MYIYLCHYYSYYHYYHYLADLSALTHKQATSVTGKNCCVLFASLPIGKDRLVKLNEMYSEI